MFKLVFILVLVLSCLGLYYTDAIHDINKDGKTDLEDIIQITSSFINGGRKVDGEKKVASAESESPAVSENSKTEAVEKEQEVVQKQEPESQQKKLSFQKFGTGWFINNNMVVTNNHVIEGCDVNNIYIRNAGIYSKAWKLRSISDNSTITSSYDIVILKSEEPSEHYARLQAFYSVRKGERLYSLGHPNGKKTFSKFKVDKLHGQIVAGRSGAVSFERSSGGFNIKNGQIQESLGLIGDSGPGASGSAIVNKYGNIVAVLYAGFQGRNEISSTNALHLRKILNEYDVKYDVDRNKNYMSSDEINEMMEKYTVKVMC